MNPVAIKEQLKMLAGPEQSFTTETAPAHAGLAEVHESIELEIANAIYDTIVKEKYKQCLEIGTHYGCATAWMLCALEMIGAGKLTTVDTQAWDRQVWREVGLGDERLTQHVWPTDQQGDVRVYWYMRNGAMPKLPARFDFILVDAAHSVDETTALVSLLAPRVVKGGQIAFHDSYAYRQGVAVPLSKYFGAAENESKWMTYDLPVGCGCYIARRIA